MSSVPASVSVLRAGLLARLRPDEGNMRDALEMRGAFQQQAVIAEEIAVISSKHHDRFTRQSARRQLRQDAADGVIDHRDHAAAQSHRLARLLLVDRESGLPAEHGLPLARCSSAHATERANGRLP